MQKINFFPWEDPRILHFKDSEGTWGRRGNGGGSGMREGRATEGGIEEGGWGTFVDV